MQLYIHDDDETTLVLACDHLVASANPTNIVARYAAGHTGPELLTIPAGAMQVTVRPLDQSALRAIKRKARPRPSQRGETLAARIQAKGRAAIQAEIKAASIEGRMPDTDVAQDAMDKAVARLDETDVAALEQHKAHRLAVIYAIASRCVVSIDPDGAGATIADRIAESLPGEAHRFAEAYPAQWVADRVLTPTLSMTAHAFYDDAEAALDAARAEYRAAVRAVSHMADAAQVVALADASAGVDALLSESGNADDRITEAVAKARKGAGDDADAVEALTRAAFAQADAQRAAVWRGTTNGAAVMAEVSTHIERLARLGKALAT